MLVNDLAFARPGDKGNDSDITVFARNRAAYDHLVRELTSDRVKTHLGAMVRGPVTRWEVPNVLALKYLLADALDGGGPASLRADNLGEALAGALPKRLSSSTTRSLWGYQVGGTTHQALIPPHRKSAGRLSFQTTVRVALVLGFAMFLRRLWVAPVATPTDRLAFGYAAFRGVALLSGVTFIALGPRRGLVANLAGLAAALGVLMATAATTTVSEQAVTALYRAALQVGVYGALIITLFRFLAASDEAHRTSAAIAKLSAELAYLDDLTGLPNRRHMRKGLETAVRQAVAGSKPTAIFMFDLDHFKTINGTLGHDDGDKVLRRASLTAQEALREGDVLARWGGEEFLVLLAGADLATGCAVAERCRKALADVTGVEAVTASFGVTPIASTDSVVSVLSRADQALYHAKLDGRNQVAAASLSGTMLVDPLGML